MELFSLKLYAKKRAAEFYVRPTINWNSDALILLLSRDSAEGRGSVGVDERIGN